MAYDKPKIFIDLDEYNDLQKLKEITVDDTVLMCKEIVRQLILSNGNGTIAMGALIKKGIKMHITKDTSVRMEDQLEIFFERIKTEAK